MNKHWQKRWGNRKRRESAATSSALFWKRVNVFGPIPKHAPHLGRCWEWTGALDIEGYGRLSTERDGKQTYIRAHRRAFELLNGPAENCVLHKCDNRKCVRHLYDGTRTQNAADRDARGRGRGRGSNKVR